MKTLIIIITLLITTAISAQFDRILTSPITENPSYVGSTGKKRIIAHGSLQKMKHQQLISYDFFSNKLKGGWGIELSNNSLFDSKEAILRVAYSPKLSPWNKGVTWAPGIGLLYSNMYKQEYKAEALEPLPTEFYEDKKNTLQVSLGLTRNSKKSLSSILFRYDVRYQIIENELSYFLKLDRNKGNNFSSTIGLRNHFFHRSYKNNVSIGTHGKIELSNTDPYIFDFRVTHAFTQNKIGIMYAIKLGNLKLDLSAQTVLWAKSVLHENIKYVESENYRELSYLDSENKLQATLSYQIKKLTVFVQGTYGFLKPIKNESYDPDPEQVTPIQNPDGTTTGITAPTSTQKYYFFSYKRATIGATYNF